MLTESNPNANCSLHLRFCVESSSNMLRKDTQCTRKLHHKFYLSRSYWCRYFAANFEIGRCVYFDAEGILQNGVNIFGLLCTKGKKEKKIPDTISVDDSIKIVEGAEKFDLIGSAAGIDDPFEPAMMEQALELGTFACPNLVPSTDEWRIVGCLCDEDAVEIKYTILNKGEKKQCDCGKWFQLVPVELQDM